MHSEQFDDVAYGFASRFGHRRVAANFPCQLKLTNTKRLAMAMCTSWIHSGKFVPLPCGRKKGAFQAVR